MKIINKTKNLTIAQDAKESKNLYENLFGLIFSKKPSSMVFHTRFGLHSFFMKYPIDVIVLNQNHQVAAIKNNLKPNRIFVWNPVHSFIIELPPGTIEKTGTEIGDQLLI